MRLGEPLVGGTLQMLRSKRDFEALQRSKLSRVHPLMTVRLLPTDRDATRFGLSTGRRIGGAVQRNRVRRRIREILRMLGPRLVPGWDVLIVARPASAGASQAALAAALERILGTAGLLVEGEKTDR